MTWSKAFICGCRGLSLSEDERAFFGEERPWGLILFRRNIQEVPQIKSLIDDFRSCVGRPDAPVLIDQEGGRVQRMQPPNWPAYPSAAKLGAVAGGADARREAVRLAARLIADDLRRVGVTVDCMPVLDIPAEDGHQVIGDRAYATSPDDVAVLGAAAIEGLLAGGVLPVVKHVPGHGRARADSHHELPVVHAPIDSLEKIDFAPFKSLSTAPLAMTAHVVYEALDPHAPATLSKKVVQDVIRGAIGFDGLLMTDDVSMKALSGSFQERTRAALDAGVDVVLHCNGDLLEAAEVALASPVLEGVGLERARRALDLIAGPQAGFDRERAWGRLQSLLAASAS